ncbi:hypothetical protein Q8F55_008272 [Vanrija albida]|uniref:DUF676 domain-containing protein n=1 Tax=Vanrija albida TaxID=181172 RepID=A0ABR3PVS6_9TREE
MPATLSPFRYIQVARYLLQWWLETAPGFEARRRAAQAKAAQLIYAPRLRRFAAAPTVHAALDEGEGGAAQKVRTTSRRGTAAERLAPPPEAEIGLPPNTDPTEGPVRQQPTLAPQDHTEIYRLMNDQRAFLPGSMQPPREIIVLCHGLYGFSTATPIPLFPSLKLHYWASVLEVLRDRMGAKVVVVGVKGTGSIQERAEQMHAFLKSYLPKGVGVNFVAHSMGGLDARHLISTIKPTEYKPLSLTTIATPHRGSPFMDWCAANIGVGTEHFGGEALQQLPFSLDSPLLVRDSAGRAKTGGGQPDTLASFTSGLTNYLLKIFDSPAYSNLTTAYLRDVFNPSTPDDPNVKYMSVAGRLAKMSVLHPLWFPKLVLDSAAEKGFPAGETAPGQQYQGNDGLVSVSSAKWGEFMGVVDGCHHWDLRGEGGLWPQGGSLRDAPTGRPDETKPGGWDWQGGVGGALGLRDGPGRTGDACATGEGVEVPTGKRDQQLDPAQHKRDLATARAMSPVAERPKRSNDSWDLAQVGQLIDWVGDLFPGDKKQDEKTHQMADATKEHAGKKIVREKFDLARFYGGLMLRLREEGL